MGSRAFGVGAACLAGLWSLASPALAQAQPQSAAPVKNPDNDTDTGGVDLIA